MLSSTPYLRTSILFFVLSTSIFAIWMFGLHWNLATNMYYLTADDFSAHFQLMFNARQGRLLQTSYILCPLGVTDCSTTYAHWFGNHVAITPFLLTPVLAFLPRTPHALYALFNLAIFPPALFFAWKIIERRSPDTAMPRFLLVASLVLASCFVQHFQYHCQPKYLLLPVLLAVYFCYISERFILFLVVSSAATMIQEDVALFMISFGGYLLFFEDGWRKEKRRWVLGQIAVAVVFVGVVLWLLQPTARANLGTVVQPSYTEHYLREHFGGDLRKVFDNVVLTAEPMLRFSLGFVVVGLLVGGSRSDIRKVAGLTFLAPASHWCLSGMVYAYQHGIQIMMSMILALIVLASGSDARKRSWRIPAAALTFLVYLALSVDYNRDLLPVVRRFLPAGNSALQRLFTEQRNWLYRLGSREAFLAQQESNHAIARLDSRIPPEESVTLLVNQTVSGAFFHRGSVWEFPLNYDRVTYLLLQKDALDTPFRFPNDVAPMPLHEAIGRGQREGGSSGIPEAFVKKLVRELVENRRSHTIEVDDTHVLLLRRLAGSAVPPSPQTIGLGFLRNELP